MKIPPKLPHFSLSLTNSQLLFFFVMYFRKAENAEKEYVCMAMKDEKYEFSAAQKDETKTCSNCHSCLTHFAFHSCST